MSTSEPLRLAASGLDIERIATQLGCDVDEAARRLAADSAAMREKLPDSEDDRLIERIHLDILRRSLLPAALSGDIGAARLLVRIHAARALLLGLLDETTTVDLDVAEGESELDRIRARRAARRSATP